MRDAPAGGGEELAAVRTEFAQILEVPAPGSLVHGRVELEADHVEAIGQPGYEPAVVVSLEALDEAVRQAQIEQ